MPCVEIVENEVEAVRGGEVVWVDGTIDSTSRQLGTLPNNQPAASGWSAPHQRRNISLAQAVLKSLGILNFQLPPPLPGRLQIGKFASRSILVDGCHNSEGVAALTVALGRDKNSTITWVIALSSGKSKLIKEFPILAEDRIILTEFAEVDFMPWVKAEDAELLMKELVDLRADFLNQPLVEKDPVKAVQIAAGSNDLIVLCGSLYLVRNFLNSVGFDDEKKFPQM